MTLILSGRLLFDTCQTPRPGWLRIEGDRIVELGEGRSSGPVDAGGSDHLIAPGFVDAHIHLPQIDAIGFDGRPLLDWLEEFIFPAEARWGDRDVAWSQAGNALLRMVEAGTLGYAGYLTAHADSLEAAADAHRRVPLHGIAGQVLMDRSAPSSLLGHPPAPAHTTSAERLSTSVNPRFAVACTDGLLAEARRRAGDKTFIQTHLAETRRECDLVREFFPDDENYTAVYDRHGLLTPRTLLAHCVHLDEAEWSLIADRDAVVVHCPTANTFLRSGVFDLAAARRHGVRLALGSDVAAGPDFAMPRVARAMIEVAKLRHACGDLDAVVPTAAEAWTMITAGNADALGFSDAGRLEVGAAADLLLLRVPFEPDEHWAARLLHTWSNDFIDGVVLAGKVI